MKIEVGIARNPYFNIDTTVAPTNLKYLAREPHFDVDLVAGLAIRDIYSIAPDRPALGRYSRFNGRTITGRHANVRVAGVDSKLCSAFEFEAFGPLVR